MSRLFDLQLRISKPQRLWFLKIFFKNDFFIDFLLKSDKCKTYKVYHKKIWISISWSKPIALAYLKLIKLLNFMTNIGNILFSIICIFVNLTIYFFHYIISKIPYPFNRGYIVAKDYIMNKLIISLSYPIEIRCRRNPSLLWKIIPSTRNYFSFIDSFNSFTLIDWLLIMLFELLFNYGCEKMVKPNF